MNPSSLNHSFLNLANVLRPPVSLGPQIAQSGLFSMTTGLPMDQNQLKSLVAQRQLLGVRYQAKELFHQLQTIFVDGPGSLLGEENVSFEKLFLAGVCQWPGCSARGLHDQESQSKHATASHSVTSESVSQVELMLHKFKYCLTEISQGLPLFQACLNHLKTISEHENGNANQIISSNVSGKLSHSLATPIHRPSLNQQRFPQLLPPFCGSQSNPSTNPLFLSRMIPWTPTTGSEFSTGPLPQPLLLQRGGPYEPLYLPMFRPPLLTGHTSQAANNCDIFPGIYPFGVPSSQQLNTLETNSLSAAIENSQTISTQKEHFTPTRKRRRTFDDILGRTLSGLDREETREYYKNNEERPPFTYIDLIRQAIIESPEKALPLVDIYTWIQREFMYYRKNQMRWKNAVRHNLSLHKCFQRLGEHKGGVWIVNDIEFSNRRPHKISHRIYSSDVEFQDSETSKLAAFEDSPERVSTDTHFNPISREVKREENPTTEFVQISKELCDIEMYKNGFLETSRPKTAESCKEDVYVNCFN